jgi:Type II secretion system (T2SS), protein E, N-terminal domain
VDPILTTVVPDAAAAGQLSPADAPPARERIPLGQLLVAEGFLNDAQLHQALHVGAQTGERLGEVVVRQGLASEEDIARLLAEQWDLSYVDRASIWFDANALARLSREDAQRIEAMPTRVQDGRVVVAVAEPTEQRLAALREVIGEDTVVVVVPKTALEAGLHSELLASDGRAPTLLDHGKRATKRSDPPPADLVFADADDQSSDDEPHPDDADLIAAIALEPPAYANQKQARRTAAPPSAEPSAYPQGPAAAGTLAQGLAQLIEAQLGPAREASQADNERLATLERRIEQLEDDLGGNRRALAELGRHLKAVAAVLDKL